MCSPVFLCLYISEIRKKLDFAKHPLLFLFCFVFFSYQRSRTMSALVIVEVLAPSSVRNILSTQSTTSAE